MKNAKILDGKRSINKNYAMGWGPIFASTNTLVRIT